MLFDLRSRGRRRTVQVVYLILALIMLGGLLLVGVGTGSGGGILNAFTNNGSGNNQNQVINSQIKQALKATEQNPTSAGAWNQLIQYRAAASQQPPDVTSGGALTATGKKQEQAIVQDWAKYLTLTKTPDSGTAVIVAHANAALGNWGGVASAWEVFTAQNSQVPRGFACMAAASYAAKASRKGDLAASQAEQLTPKAQRAALTSELTSAKGSTTAAETAISALGC